MRPQTQSMAISGMVLTADSATSASLMVQALQQESHITVGEQRGRRVAIVMDVPDGEDLHAVDHLRLMPGVADVAIACIHFPDVHEIDSKE